MVQRLAALTVFSLLLVTGAFCQGLASLSGVVTDPSGAVVPNATVRLENVERGVLRETKSDSQGRYLLPQLQPDTYKVTAKADGFAELIVNQVVLAVSSNVTINLKFEKVGSVNEVVSVSAEAVQVNTTDATLGNAFNTTAVIQLPANARNVVGLLALQPGVVSLSTDVGDQRNGAVNGGKSDQANITLDGVDVNDQWNRTAFTSVLRVTLDSVQEFRVTTTNANPDQGRSSGAQVALITKQGSNEFHGSLYHYHRNTVTTANSFFNNKTNIGRPKLIRNIYGGSVGGPVIKNKTFFFGNFEGRQDAREDTALRTVPTASFRQGILKYRNRAGGVTELSPAQIRTQVDPGGIGVSPAAQQLFQSYPLPNDETTGDLLNTAGYRFVAPIRLRWNTYIARFDHVFDRDGRYVAFVRGNLQNDRDSGLPQFPGDPANTNFLANNKGIASGLTAAFRPNFIGTFRYGYTYQSEETAGILNSNIVTFRTFSNRIGTNTSLAFQIPVHTLTQDYNWTKGSHAFQFGMVARGISNRRRNFANSFSTASGNVGWLNGTGADLRAGVPDLLTSFNTPFVNAAVAMLGLVTQGNANYNYDLSGNVQPIGTPALRSFANEEYELYFQDTWRVSRALTITGGLRWSLMPPVRETNGIQIATNPRADVWFANRLGTMLAGTSQRDAGPLELVPADGPNAHELYPFHKKNFAPRLAIAYSPQADSGFLKWLTGGPGKTSIRAGWGMYYDLFGAGIIRALDSSRSGPSASIGNPPGGFDTRTTPRFVNLTTIPSVLLPAPPRLSYPRVPDLNGFLIDTLAEPSLRPPFTMNMNFQVGREFSSGWYLQAAYVGRLSRRSLVQRDLAMPTNLRDPQSGQTYFEAASILGAQALAEVPVASVRPVPFFENLWAGARTATLSPTQAVYNRFLINAPDFTSALQNIDQQCRPACSSRGPYSIFNSQYSFLAAFSSIGFGSYHGLQLTARKRFSGGLQADFNYTWSKSIDLTSGAERNGAGWGGGFAFNSWEARLNRGVSDYDLRHQANANWYYQLPFGRGKKFGSGMNRILDAVVGGWEVSGVFTMTSGIPRNAGVGLNWPTNWNLTGWATANRDPMQFVAATGSNKNTAGLTAGTSGPNVFVNAQQGLDSYSFTLPGQIGSRAALRTDGYFNIDGGLYKRFTMPYKDNHTLQFRWEIYNLTNTARMASPQLSIADSGTFGNYQGQLTDPRVMQFALRYEF